MLFLYFLLGCLPGTGQNNSDLVGFFLDLDRCDRRRLFYLFSHHLNNWFDVFNGLGGDLLSDSVVEIVNDLLRRCVRLRHRPGIRRLPDHDDTAENRGDDTR